MTEYTETVEEIAIVGMACRFPGAQNIEEFWSNLVNGVESITHFTDDELLSRGVPHEKLKDPNFVKAGTILPDADKFDATFFGYSQREAELIDPQQRIFLELAWESLESAGCDPDRFEGSIGVYAGASGNDYRKGMAANHQSVTSGINAFEVMMANDADFLTTRVSYKLNLKGPSFNIQTACSTSLVAVQQACLSLLTYQCDMALAGGICVRFPQGQGYMYSEGMIWSPDGHCQPFDAQARGTIFGHGGGIVVLKRLSEALHDNDTIYAIIKGAAINNDGALKAGFTAPSVDGQSEVILNALALGDVDPDTIGYVEAHGTGTQLGDPIEIEALTHAFREYTERRGFCAIGSVKSNIGHLDIAAGVAGLIKTTLSLYHKKIPANLHYTTPNPNIDFESSPFYVNDTLKEWDADASPRRAGVSSFGIGGTNAHVVLEEPPVRSKSDDEASYQLLLLSAKNEEALKRQSDNLLDYLKNNNEQNLADVAYTLLKGRKHFNSRKYIVAETCSEAVNLLDSPTPVLNNSAGSFADRKIIFMFSGQGSQHINMCHDLYQRFPVFREQVDYCSQLLQPYLNLDIRNIIYPQSENAASCKEQLTQTSIAQPALFTIEYSLAKLLESFGIFPDALIGHSIGEYTAACLAGVFSLDDCLKLVAARGRLMQSMPPGSMIAVPLTEKDVQPYLTNKISLAAVNGHKLTVLSGETAEIEKVVGKLGKLGIESRKIKTSHGFHSVMMEPIIEKFKEEVTKYQRVSLQTPFISNVTGKWILDKEAASPDYWANHIRSTVNFFDGIGHCLESFRDCIFLEVGPGQTLTMLTRQHSSTTKDDVITATSRRPIERKSDLQYFLETLGKLWQNGIVVNWQKINEKQNRILISLPTYPFERKKYWLQTELKNENFTCRDSNSSESFLGKYEKDKTIVKKQITEKSIKRRDEEEIEQQLRGIWLDLLPDAKTIDSGDSFFDLGGDSLQAMQLFDAIERETGVNLPIATLVESPSFGTLVRRVYIEEQKRVLKFKKHRGKVHQSKESNKWASLVPIQPDGDGVPFFCVHGAGSNPLNYRVFVKPLGKNQPLYGLQAQGLDGKTRPLRTIEEMSIHYIGEVKRVQPKGPYFLGGASFGGTVALEMAQQLRANGEEVAFLAMFDTQGKSKKRKEQKNDFNFFGKVLNYISFFKDSSVKSWPTRVFESLKFHLKNFYCVILVHLRRPIPHNLRHGYLEQVNIKAWHDYREKFYDGDITLFRAKNIRDKNYLPHHGWERLVKKLTVIEIPGEHNTFIEEPEVGERLAKCLKELNQ